MNTLPETSNEKSIEAFKRYAEMGSARSLRKLADETGIRLSLLGQWSSEQKWLDRLAEHDQGTLRTAIRKQPFENLADFEREQARLRTHIEEQRQRCTNVQWQLASKLSAQRLMAKERLPLRIATNTAQEAVRTAQEALSRHINTATESMYADTLYEAELQLKTAQSELTAFDKQHEDINPEHLQLERDAIRELEQSITQETEQLRTLSAEAEQAIEQQLNVSVQRILTAYHDLYTAFEREGPTMTRLRTHNPFLFHCLMPELTIDMDQLWSLLCPHIDHPEDFRPFLKERQTVMRSYLARLAPHESAE
ncbi:hypothetical protein [Dictyobacter arantiisoli]|uniref:Uncharacterized protein n=1 Tax=Dictyobacter arantiisoli TaxID=2014874 RepID=A0A5A5TKH9_9CHLR|nr:hypothetical protein [Dictyobacter arantiisoli]GCF11782.1 hypothetical protein KDI_53460 [Dictyobacter arantiisoli]